MWIAKPIQSLSSSEESAWLRLEIDLPLAQSLAWARATEAVTGRAFLVFSPDESAGGIVFTPSHRSSDETHFECINGPHLQWDDTQHSSRQFATFAMAVAKLDFKFRSLRIQPRWEKTSVTERLKLLPIPPFEQSQAATLLVPVLPTPEAQLQTLHPRLRRTLATTWKNNILTSWERVHPDALENFVTAMARFGKTKGFTVPPQTWFEALTLADPRASIRQTFWLGTAATSADSPLANFAQILVCFAGKTAYYLFGHETRTAPYRAALSPSAALHWLALEQCRIAQIQNYDLNGYLIDAKPNHPYYGVSKFKEQFQGKIVEYEIPEFLIESS